jgi:hypothetical protein
MSQLFQAGLSQAAEPVPPGMIGKGYGSVYAQLWARIAAGGVPPDASRIAEILKAPPAARPLAVAAAAPRADAKTDKPAPPDETDTADDSSNDVEADWESDVVLRPHAGAKGSDAKGKP